MTVDRTDCSEAIHLRIKRDPAFAATTAHQVGMQTTGLRRRPWLLWNCRFCDTTLAMPMGLWHDYLKILREVSIVLTHEKKPAVKCINTWCNATPQPVAPGRVPNIYCDPCRLKILILYRGFVDETDKLNALEDRGVPRGVVHKRKVEMEAALGAALLAYRAGEDPFAVFEKKTGITISDASKSIVW